MAGMSRFVFGFFTISQLLICFAQAAEPVRLAYSEKLGVTLFAYPDAGGEWCRARLGVSILIKDGSPLLTQGVDGALPKFGALFTEKCAAAASASIAVYKASDRSQIGKPFVVEKADGWVRPAEGAATVPASVPEPAACDRSPVARDYFIAGCIVRGLEFHRQSDGLEAARTRQADAAKTLQCTPQSMSKVNDLAAQASLRILSSRAISSLMDFADGMQVECRKASADQLK